MTDELEQALYDSRKYNAHQLEVIKRLKEENGALAKELDAAVRHQAQLEQRLGDKSRYVEELKRELKNHQRMLAQKSLAKLEAELKRTRQQLNSEKRQKEAALSAVAMYEMSAQLFQTPQAPAGF
jgi:Rad3-related DNA helicase